MYPTIPRSASLPRKPRPLLRAVVLVVGAIALSSLAASGCSEQEAACTPGSRCEDGAAITCYNGGQGPSYEKTTRCGRRQCVVLGSGQAVRAFEESPLCPAEKNPYAACDGTDLVECAEGWIVGRAKCAECKDAGEAPNFRERCVRGFRASCESAADCREEYMCVQSPGTGGSCYFPCVGGTACDTGITTAEGVCACRTFTY